MKVLVFRNRFGAAALWVLPGDPGQDAPEPAVLPDVIQDPRIQNMASKGAGQSWSEWADYLASQPLLGNWAVQEAPDGLDADAALSWVRRGDTAQSVLGA